MSLFGLGKKQAVHVTEQWDEAYEPAPGVYWMRCTVKQLLDLAARVSEAGYPEEATMSEIGIGDRTRVHIKWNPERAEVPTKPQATS